MQDQMGMLGGLQGASLFIGYEPDGIIQAL